MNAEISGMSLSNTAVELRLLNGARRRSRVQLKERVMVMTEENMRGERPSKDAAFVYLL